MINLYIIESPLQALCALEISLSKRDERHAIIIRISNGDRIRNDEQILEIIGKRIWYSCEIIKYRFYDNALINNVENRFYLEKIEKKFKNKTTSLYIGDFRSAFMHMVRVAVKPHQVFILDDGAATVKIISSYLKKGYHYPYDTFYPKNKIKKIIFRMLYGKYIDFKIFRKNIKVITAFSNDESNNLEILEFDNIKNLFGIEQSLDACLVYYYGSKYSEVGIISLDYEFKFLEIIKDFYYKQGKTVVYFAHRDESEKKLKHISENLKFKVIVPNTMAELYLLNSIVLPSEISGAYTSVLNNVKVIFPQITLRSFELKSEEISEKWRKDIESIYIYYKELGLNVES